MQEEAKALGIVVIEQDDDGCEEAVMSRSLGESSSFAPSTLSII